LALTFFSSELNAQTPAIDIEYRRVNSKMHDFEQELKKFEYDASQSSAKKVKSTAQSLDYAIKEFKNECAYQANNSSNPESLRRAYSDLEDKISTIYYNKLVRLSDLLVNANCWTSTTRCNYVYRYKDIISEYNNAIIIGFNKIIDAYSKVKNETKRAEFYRQLHTTKNHENEYTTQNSQTTTSPSSIIKTVTYESGNVYTGEFKDGKKHGKGEYTYTNGDKYVGEFKEGKLHGQGTYTFASGAKYVGEFKDDKRHGQGTYTFADGAKYVGEYKDNKRHGQGMYINFNNVKFEGIWVDGLLNGQNVNDLDKIKNSAK
jgi:hypothetical protein